MLLSCCCCCCCCYLCLALNLGSFSNTYLLASKHKHTHTHTSIRSLLLLCFGGAHTPNLVSITQFSVVAAHVAVCCCCCCCCSVIVIIHLCDYWCVCVFLLLKLRSTMPGGIKHAGKRMRGSGEESA